MKEEIYYLKDMTIENRLEWITGLNKSGYAGMQKGTGMLCDRREFPKAIPVQENISFGVVKPKELLKHSETQITKKSLIRDSESLRMDKAKALSNRRCKL